MKEDILEQLVDDYLKSKGFFTIHNVKFRPSSEHLNYEKAKDCVASDVDVVGFHPRRGGYNKVWVVSCKSWQNGFDPKARINAIENDKVLDGRKAWQGFRELVKPKWAEALIEEIKKLTGTTQFTYITAVTKLIGPATTWEQNEKFKKNLGGNPIKILTLKEMLSEIYTTTKTSVASSEVGRLLQVIKASRWKPDA